MSKTIKKGDTVKVHYTGTLEDGTEFDSSRNSRPLQFVVGEHQVIPGFENAVLDHAVGDTFSVTIPPAEAYGDIDKELIFEVPREQVPPTITPEKGLGLSMRAPQGEIDVIIKDVTDTHLTLDANHPLAGQPLTFELEIVEIA